MHTSSFHLSLFIIIIFFGCRIDAFPILNGITKRRCLSSNTKETTTTVLRNDNSGSSSSSSSSNDEDDPFGFGFDPRLSPHMYPNGISRGSSKAENSASTTPTITTSSDPAPSSNQENDEDDPFGFGFDPRLSPHMYPNGISRGKPKQTASPPPELVTPSSLSEHQSNDEEDPFGFGFDPRLSPHMYPSGIPSTTSYNTGILLIDHGSKRPESNAHLHTLASTYQKSPRCPNHCLVRAAHMEIAIPSIDQAFRELIVVKKVTKIICVPYFLSPGRHATEDVPRLIRHAVENLETKDDVDVVVAEPIGRKVDVLVNAIGDIVEERMRMGFGGGSGGGVAGFEELKKLMDQFEKKKE